MLFLGQEGSRDDALASIEKYRTLDLDAALKAVTDFWDQTLGIVQVKTPDRSMDVILNGWLLYQTLACRLVGTHRVLPGERRVGLPRSTPGCHGTVHGTAGVAREQILRAASRQFEAGDVQHWWLPATDQGIQTRVSDDRIWLPFVLAHYLEVTEDFAIWMSPSLFWRAARSRDGQQELFAAPKPAGAAPLYDHCALALDSSLAIGSHGLPLFGTGDWNDGMNRVGIRAAARASGSAGSCTPR